MERTLEIMEAELNAANEQFEPLKKKISELKREIERYKLDNALYHPMSELMNYKGKNIYSINLVEKMRDGKLTTDYMYADEWLEVTDDGYLHYSSYAGGIMDYNKDDEKYYHCYYGHSTPHEYVGFLEIEVEED